MMGLSTDVWLYKIIIYLDFISILNWLKTCKNTYKNIDKPVIYLRCYVFRGFPIEFGQIARYKLIPEMNIDECYNTTHLAVIASCFKNFKKLYITIERNTVALVQDTIYIHQILTNNKNIYHLKMMDWIVYLILNVITKHIVFKNLKEYQIIQSLDGDVDNDTLRNFVIELPKLEKLKIPYNKLWVLNGIKGRKYHLCLELPSEKTDEFITLYKNLKSNYTTLDNVYQLTIIYQQYWCFINVGEWLIHSRNLRRECSILTGIICWEIESNTPVTICGDTLSWGNVDLSNNFFI